MIQTLLLASLLQVPVGQAVYEKHCASCHEQSRVTRAPDRETMRQRPPEAILASLISGTMVAQAAPLSDAEKRAVTEYLAGKPLGAAASVEGGMCVAPKPLGDPSSGSAWQGWGGDPANTRFAARGGLSAADVPRLKLKWAFGFPNGTSAFSQPSVVAGRVFVGSDKGKVFSLDAATGCTYWSFAAEAGVRTAVSVARVGTQTVAVFGDTRANVYGVNAATGEQLWKVKVDEHRYARITGSPAISGTRVYVPVSSVEEAVGAGAKYECCTFRGSVVAMDLATGKQFWKSYTIPEAPQPTKKNSQGVQQYAPAGAAIWSAPTIDLKRKAIYVGTGNGYTEPAADTSDAVVAFDMDTGKMLWHSQVTPKDHFLMRCPGENCQGEQGPDYDFGNAPILRELPGGKRVIAIGQKSGVAWGLDPDAKGKILWQTRLGKGGALGGLEWGSAADEQNFYGPVSDVLLQKDAGGIGAVRLNGGEKIWFTPAPKLDCTLGRGCNPAQSAPATVIPGAVFSGSVDGHLRAYSTKDGSIIWDFNTKQEYQTVNGVPGKGGSLDASGPAVAGGILFSNSGYGAWMGAPGNVLLAFTPDGK